MLCNVPPNLEDSIRLGVCAGSLLYQCTASYQADTVQSYIRGSNWLVGVVWSYFKTSRPDPPGILSGEGTRSFVFRGWYRGVSANAVGAAFANESGGGGNIAHLVSYRSSWGASLVADQGEGGDRLAV